MRLTPTRNRDVQASGSDPVCRHRRPCLRFRRATGYCGALRFRIAGLAARFLVRQGRRPKPSERCNPTRNPIHVRPSRNPIRSRCRRRPPAPLVLLAGQELALAPTARGIDERMKGALSKAARAADFTGKAKTPIEILAPSRHRHRAADAAGHGQGRERARPSAARRLRLRPDQRPQGRGGHASSPSPPTPARRAPRCSPPTWRSAPCCAATPSRNTAPTQAARTAPRRSRRDGLRKLVIQCAKPDAAAKAFAARKALAEGVFLARDLVNEPANMLGPVEFAERMRDLAQRRRSRSRCSTRTSSPR